MTTRILLAAGGAAVALLVAGFLGGGACGVVDWSQQRAVVLESDDWGLAGFVPDGSAWDGIDRAALDPGRFPAVYWGSTLEDSGAVAALGAILGGARDRDGRPAVLQPNYITGSLGWEDDRWVAYGFPAVPRAYHRPGLSTAVADAVRAGIWHPEWHGSWHYDPALRRERALASETARRSTERGILLFPGSEQARELGPWRPLDVLEAELEASLARFAAAFGRPPASVVAPDYTWSGRHEAMWARHGLRVIQAKREQRDPELPRGGAGRLVKLLTRRWDELAHRRRVYLERNCRFEPVQSDDPAAVTARCAREIRRAWRRGEPAIVETHRVNFAHTDPAVIAVGQGELRRLLEEVVAARPVFLTDSEVAQLAREGVSIRSRPGRIILRNASHSRRLVVVDAAAQLHAGPERASTAGPAGPLLVLLPAGTSVDLVPGRDGWREVGADGLKKTPQ